MNWQSLAKWQNECFASNGLKASTLQLILDFAKFAIVCHLIQKQGQKGLSRALEQRLPYRLRVGQLL